MASLVILVNKSVEDKIRKDDGLSDRLSRQYTTTILMLFSVVVTTKLYVGEQINCWAPNHFTDNHVDYANDFCWIRSTYNLPFEEEVPKEGEEWKQETLVYYQWVSLILLGQAFLFFFPCLLWRSFAPKSGLDIHNVTENARAAAKFPIKTGATQPIFDQMTTQINRYLSHCKRDEKTRFTISLKHLFSRTCCILCGRQRGNYLIALYLFIKVLYLINAFGQLFLLNVLLGTDFHMYGIKAIEALSHGNDLAVSPAFPRVTMCNFKVRRLGNVHRYTVQCLLPVNLFNEKIYLFLWFWFIFVTIVTILSLLKWSLRAVIKIDRRRYIKKHLKFSGVQINTQAEKEEFDAFVDSYLQQDGVFIIHLIEQSTSTLTALEVTKGLWDECRKRNSND